MSYHYKAFISYRHKPLDSDVAAKVQHTIEHYTVPRDLRDPAGGKKLGKVFRDEDELPLSSSLSDSIVDALDDSEFLIVVCTPDLPLSKWCEQEIRHFLSTRDRDHIITVLADGAPGQSFSPLLLHKYDEKGNVTGDVEPVAANIVADTDRKRGRLFAKEKFRILASLIGCSFDELYKREQRYKRRRAFVLGSAASALALLFIGILLNRNAVIKQNYEQALRNQSMYLAAESQRLLDEGDRFSAIALAIEALPSEENERPLLSQAEQALASSVKAYETGWDRTRRSNYTVNSALKHSNEVRSYMLSENGDMLVSLSMDSIVTAWDTEKSSSLWTVQVEDHNEAGLIDILPDNTVMIYDNADICFLDGQSGSVKHKLEWPGERGFGAISGTLTSTDHSRLAVSSFNGIYVFDTESKKELCSIENPEGENQIALAFSNDGTRIAAVYYHDLLSRGYDGIRVYDTESGSMIKDLDSFAADGLSRVDVLFAEDNKLCVSYTPFYMDISSSGMSIIFFTEIDHYLSLFDLESGEKIWEVASKYSLTNDNHQTIYTDLLGSAPVYVNIYSNFVDIVDAGTGEVLTHAEYPSVIVHADVYNGAVQCIGEDGGFGGLNAGATTWSMVYSFVNGIKGVMRSGSDYWMLRYGSDSILHCGYTEQDPSWIEFKDDVPDPEYRFYTSEPVFDKANFVVMSEQKGFLYFDAGTKELRYTALPDGAEDPEEPYTYTPIRFKDGVLSLLKSPRSRGASELWNINVKTADRMTYAQTDDTIVQFNDVIGDSAGEEWYAFVTASGKNQLLESYFVSFDYEFRIKNKIPVKGLLSGWFWDKDGSVYVKYGGTEEVYVIDLKTFAIQECSGEFGRLLASVDYFQFETHMTYDAAAHITVVNTGDRAVVFDQNKAVISQAGDGSYEIISASVAGDGKYLLALCSDDQIRRFDLKTGQLLGRCDVGYDCSSLFQHVSWAGTDKGFTLMMIENDCTFLISEDDWVISALIPNCTAYLPSEDLFVFIPDRFINGNKAGGFKRHTAETLKEYGREILGEWELSETQKMQYGIK